MTSSFRIPNPDQKSNRKLVWKIIAMLLLIAFLMIPNAMVQDLIRERYHRYETVQSEVSQSWGNRQTLKGLILCIPYTQEIQDKEGEIQIIQKNFFLLPDEITYDGKLEANIRKRSIYEVLLYSTELNSKVKFNLQKLKDQENAQLTIHYDKAIINLAISDPKAVSKLVTIGSAENENSVKLSSGSPFRNIIGNGLSADYPIDPEISSLSLTYDLFFNGSEGLYFFPTGTSTEIKLQGRWDDPSFQGNILPVQFEINNDGFSAEWQTNEYSRSTPSTWSDHAYSLNEDQQEFGVKLIKTANQYQQNTRSAKYSLLIIALTFALFFGFEIFYKLKIHPIQYTLVGFSLSLFYLLLLSISEHLGFALAYSMASLVTIFSIVLYGFFILKNSRKLSILTSLLVVLYAYIYVLLQLEEFALLAGSIGLFLILGSAMYLTRKVDWYSIDKLDGN